MATAGEAGAGQSVGVGGVEGVAACRGENERPSSQSARASRSAWAAMSCTNAWANESTARRMSASSTARLACRGAPSPLAAAGGGGGRSARAAEVSDPGRADGASEEETRVASGTTPLVGVVRGGGGGVTGAGATVDAEAVADSTPLIGSGAGGDGGGVPAATTPVDRNVDAAVRLVWTGPIDGRAGAEGAGGLGAGASDRPERLTVAARVRMTRPGISMGPIVTGRISEGPERPGCQRTRHDGIGRTSACFPPLAKSGLPGAGRTRTGRAPFAPPRPILPRRPRPTDRASAAGTKKNSVSDTPRTNRSVIDMPLVARHVVHRASFSCSRYDSGPGAVTTRPGRLPGQYHPARRANGRTPLRHRCPE